MCAMARIAPLGACLGLFRHWLLILRSWYGSQERTLLQAGYPEAIGGAYRKVQR